MSIFSTLLSKLGMGAKAAPARAPASAPASTRPAASGTATASQPATQPAPAPAPPPVDIEAVLEQRAAASNQKLNWRTSIVDLLKLLEMDSSLGARKELATELGCPADLMNDSAKMNMWLHKTVLARVAANGGRVPKELLD
jgi:hypothetical protein